MKKGQGDFRTHSFIPSVMFIEATFEPGLHVGLRYSDGLEWSSHLRATKSDKVNVAMAAS